MQEILNLVNLILDEAKAQDIVAIDVTGRTPLMDQLIIATGTSTRHVKSMAEHLLLEAKKQKFPSRVQGLNDGEWVLIDLNDVVVHLMTPTMREFYQIEKLWSDQGDAEA
jgi:ribosome-associated protein